MGVDNVDRRFANNIENIFFKTMKIIISKVVSSTWVRLCKAQLQGRELCIKDIRADTNIERLLSSRIGYKDFEALRTSRDYKNIFPMIRQLGPPNFFVTFSCVEKSWSPILQCLRAINPQLQQENGESESPYIRCLIRADPVITARYYMCIDSKRLKKY